MMKKPLHSQRRSAWRGSTDRRRAVWIDALQREGIGSL
jgi:hypothetical protein